MSVVRRRYTSNFTTISNELFEDERLAADELGVLAWLRSRPPNWEVKRWAIGRRFNMGRERLARVFQNFVGTGWVIAERVRLADGTSRVDYVVNDSAGPALTTDEVKALLLIGGANAEAAVEPPTADPYVVEEPPTAQPATADPYVVSLYLQNTESQTKAIALDAGASRDVRTRLFNEGLRTLAAITGRTPDSCRSLIGKWLKLVNDEAIHVLGAIEDAARNRIADPTAWINASLQPHACNRTNHNGNNRTRNVSDVLRTL